MAVRLSGVLYDSRLQSHSDDNATPVDKVSNKKQNQAKELSLPMPTVREVLAEQLRGIGGRIIQIGGRVNQSRILPYHKMRRFNAQLSEATSHLRNAAQLLAGEDLIEGANNQSPPGKTPASMLRN